MTLSEIFSHDFLFNPVPPAESRLYLPLFLLFSLLVFISFLTFFVKEDMRPITRKFSYSFVLSGLLGYLYLFGRYESLAWIGSRFFLLLNLGLLAIWVIIATVITVRYLPKFIRHKKVEEKFEKYLPKAKSNIKNHRSRLARAQTEKAKSNTKD